MKGEKRVKIHRRDFIEKSVLAAAGIGLVGGISTTANAIGAASQPEPQAPVLPLRKATLGRTGLEVTVVTFGTVPLRYANVLTKGIDAGINLVHTAESYGHGAAIKAVGEAMATHRDKVTLALKTHPGSIENYLDTLQTDHVDLVVSPLHGVDAVKDPRVKESFDKMKTAGKVKFLGFACHKDMANVLSTAADMGVYDFALMGYGDMESDVFKKAVEKAKKAGMGLLSMKGLPRSVRDDAALLSAQVEKVLNEGGADTVLASMSSFEDVEKYLKIASDSQAAASSNALYAALQSSQLCHMCGKCSDCPKGVDICEIMRCERYALDCGWYDRAREKYQGLTTQEMASNCSNCEQCSKACPYGIASPERLARIHSLLA